MKRVIVATVSGLVFGFVCFGFASSGPEPLAWPLTAQIILSRTLLGFAIGISSLNLGHWAVHGLIIGTIFSLPLAFSGLMAPENPQFSHTTMWVSTMVMGMIYGVVIELVTSVVFKAKQRY